MSGEILSGDRAKVLLDQPPLWSGKSSWAQLLILRVPTGILLLLFDVAFGWALLEGAKQGFRTLSRYSNAHGRSALYFLTPLEITSWGLLLVGLSLFFFLRPLLDIRRRRFALTQDGLIVRDGKLAIVWPHEDLLPVSFDPIVGGYRVGFGRDDGELPDIYLSQTQARHLVVVLRDTVAGVDESAIRYAPTTSTSLLPEERILWEGRRGLASISMMRRIGLGALAVPVIGYGVVVRQVIGYSDSTIGLIMGLLLTFMAGGISVVAAVIAFSSLLRDYLLDVVGRMIVTDRRIVWAAPITGHLYREVSGELILDVNLIEISGRNGWVALRIGRPDGWSEMDLHGVPRATEAVAAISRIIG